MRNFQLLGIAHILMLAGLAMIALAIANIVFLYFQGVRHRAIVRRTVMS